MITGTFGQLTLIDRSDRALGQYLLAIDGKVVAVGGWSGCIKRDGTKILNLSWFDPHEREPKEAGEWMLTNQELEMIKAGPEAFPKIAPGTINVDFDMKINGKTVVAG